MSESLWSLLALSCALKLYTWHTTISVFLTPDQAQLPWKPFIKQLNRIYRPSHSLFHNTLNLKLSGGKKTTPPQKKKTQQKTNPLTCKITPHPHPLPNPSFHVKSSPTHHNKQLHLDTAVTFWQHRAGQPASSAVLLPVDKLFPGAPLQTSGWSADPHRVATFKG